MFYNSPGTTDTGIHMRAGMDEENYRKVRYDMKQIQLDN